MGLIRLQPWDLKEASRCTQIHTCGGMSGWRQNHLHVYSVCKNKPTDSSRLQTSGVLQSLQDGRGGRGLEH